MDARDLSSTDRQTNALGAFDRAMTGSVGISAPDSAVVDTPFTVLLRVGVDKLDVMLKDLAAEVPENENRTGKSGIKLTPRMGATLSGLGFEISPEGQLIQAINPAEPTTWQWQAKATKSGTLSLHFTLSQTVIVEGKEVAKNYPFRKTLLVEVKPFSLREFTTENWQWLISILLLPLAKVLWDLFVKSRYPTPKSS